MRQLPITAVLPLDEFRGDYPLKQPQKEILLTLHQAIDYDKLTPTQQVRYDAGLYGSIELKAIGIYHYYYCRWTEPSSKRRRSTELGKDWNAALSKLYLLLHPIESIDAN